MRAAFQRWVDEDKAPEDQCRPRATKLVRIMTGDNYVDPSIVEWIIARSPGAEGDRRQGLGMYSVQA